MKRLCDLVMGGCEVGFRWREIDVEHALSDVCKYPFSWFIAVTMCVDNSSKWIQ